MLVKWNGAINLVARGTVADMWSRHFVDSAQILQQVSTIVEVNPKTAVLIEADARVSYGKVYEAMALMQQAKVARVGFISQPVADK